MYYKLQIVYCKLNYKYLFNNPSDCYELPHSKLINGKGLLWRMDEYTTLVQLLTGQIIDLHESCDGGGRVLMDDKLAWLKHDFLHAHHMFNVESRIQTFFKAYYFLDRSGVEDGNEKHYLPVFTAYFFDLSPTTARTLATLSPWLFSRFCKTELKLHLETIANIYTVVAEQSKGEGRCV